MARFPIRRKSWYWTLPLHLLVASGFGVADTAIMTLSRTWLYPMLQLGHYRPGQLFFRYLMELHKQLLIYAMIAGIYYVRWRVQAARMREQEKENPGGDSVSKPTPEVDPEARARLAALGYIGSFADPAKLKDQGRRHLGGHGRENHCTILTITESPLKEGVIWVGTDDGMTTPEILGHIGHMHGTAAAP
jgi:hypothetical protein